MGVLCGRANAPHRISLRLTGRLLRWPRGLFENQLSGECCRRFAAPLEARAGARGSSVDSLFSWALSWLGGEQRSRGWSGLSEETSPTGLLCVQRWGRWNYWNSFCSKTSPACPLQDIPLIQQRPLLPHKPTPSLQRPPRGEKRGGRPLRGASSSPSRRCWKKRLRHLHTI